MGTMVEAHQVINMSCISFSHSGLQVLKRQNENSMLYVLTRLDCTNISCKLTDFCKKSRALFTFWMLCTLNFPRPKTEMFQSQCD